MKTKHIITIAALLLIGLWIISYAACSLNKKLNISEYQSKIKHDSLLSKVNSSQLKLDSILIVKTKSDGKSKTFKDSTNSYIKNLQKENNQLRYKLNQNKSNSNSLTGEEKRKYIDSVEDFNLNETYLSIIDSELKDSTITNQDKELLSNQALIDQDQIDGTICNQSLQVCLSANKAKENLLSIDEPKLKVHPLIAWIKKESIKLSIGANIVKDGILIYIFKVQKK